MADVPLREHLEGLLREQDRRIEQAQQAAKAAVEKAEYAIDKRLDLLNEFRAQAADEASKYVRHDQTEILKERIADLESARDRAFGAILLLAMIGIANLVKLFW